MAEEVLTVARMGAKDETGPAFRSIQNNMRNTVKQSKAVNNQFRLLRGGAGQVGHQIQDIAVQLQMGTNAMIVFGQQGSQIASLFGPQGAMIGAVLAVGAAISVAFTKDVAKGNSALQSMRDQIEENIEKTGELKNEFIDFLILDFAKQQQDHMRAMRETNRELSNQEDMIGMLTMAQSQHKNQLMTTGSAQATATELARDYKQEIKESRDEITRLEAQQKLQRERLKEINTALGRLSQGKNPFVDLGEQAQKSKNSTQEFVESLDRTTISTSAGQVAAKAYELSLLDLEGAELDAALAALGRYEQALLDAEADREAAKAAKERAAAERAMFEQAQKGIIQSDEQRKRDEAAERRRRTAQLDRLRTFEEFKKELGDTFLQMKKLEDGLVGVTENAMANFTDSFYDAITGAKNFKDAFKDMARSIVEDLSKMLIQYYITQQIFGAIVSMFPGGGTTSSTGGGGGGGGGGGYSMAGLARGGVATANTPYVVGEKGPELFIPSTTGRVVPNNQLGGGGVTVVQNINVTTGVQQTVRAEIANLLPQISNAAKSAVADARLRGGGFSKAMVGT